MTLPVRAELIEVGLRDGLQAQRRVITTEAKLELLEGLLLAGLKNIQVASFVNPRKVPQMADADELVAELLRRPHPGVRFSGLALNLRGVQRLAAAGLRHADVSLSASEAHSVANSGMGVAEAALHVAEAIGEARALGLRVRGGIQCAFGHGDERVPPERVAGLAAGIAESGAEEIALADTAGVASPLQIEEVLAAVRRTVRNVPLVLHLHDTRGMGLANLLAALRQGVVRFDTAFGGLGGCPFLEGATGNVATEDVAHMLHGMGVNTGVNIEAVCRVSERARELLDTPLPSRIFALRESRPGPRQPRARAANGPLAGVTVLEMSHAVLGPTAGLILADLGAEVIRIEPPPDGDPTRALKGFGLGYYPFFNRNKKSVILDAKSEEGGAILARLLERADVLIENFAPGTMERLGLGHERLSALYPRLVYCSLKGFLPGPYDNRVALDEVVQMMSGLAYMTGPSGRPLRAGASIMDVTTGIFGAMGVLVALQERRLTGKGQLVRSALFETAAFIMGHHLAYSAASGEPVPPMPERVSAWAVYDQFRTADDRIVFVGITSDRQWERFCRVFGRDDLARDPDLAGNNERSRRRDRLVPDLARMFAGMNLETIVHRCEEAGLPFAPVGRPEDLFADPQLQGSGSLLPTLVGDREVPLPALPLRLGVANPVLRNSPPAAGAHTFAVLESMGYRPEWLQELARRGVIRLIE